MNHPPESGVTLQINSLAALERLLGGDNELTVSIRKSVAAAFVRNYITDLIRSEFTQKDAELKKAIADEVAKVCLQKAKYSVNWVPTYELTPAIKEKIQSEVTTLVSNVIRDEVVRQSDALMTLMKDELEKLRGRIPALVAERVTNKFNKEVSDALDARLKELRALLPADPPETRRINIS